MLDTEDRVVGRSSGPWRAGSVPQPLVKAPGELRELIQINAKGCPANFHTICTKSASYKQTMR